MYRTILVPLDGSRYAEAAVPLARAIAERSGAKLHLVMVHHSVVPGGIPEGFSAYAEESRRAEQDYLSRAPEPWLSHSPSLPSRCARTWS